jgi:quinol monooxygenase YgiN
VLVQSIRYTFAPADADEAARMFRELRDLSRQEDGVVSFEVARAKDKPNVFVLWEEYRDEAALASHFATQHFARLAVDGIRRLAIDRAGETALPLP